MINIIDKHSLLSLAQINLLQQCSSLTFNIGKFKSLDDILTQLKVDVIIEPGTPTRTVPSSLEDALKYWTKEADRLRKQKSADSPMSKRYRKVINIVESIQSTIYRWPQMSFRGLHDSNKNVIILYPEVMMKEFDGQFMDELLVSTLAHEAMHAYFNRPRHKSYPYVIFVEEPLAEFGMLLYLNETVPSYYNWAYEDVKNKKTCYRYGAQLMNLYLNGVSFPIREYLEQYKFKIAAYEIPTIDSSRGVITMPQINGSSGSSVVINGHRISKRWKDVFKKPPKYFYDSKTKTLGFDGFWGGHMRWNTIIHYLDIDIDIQWIHRIDNIYMGDDFYVDHYDDLDYISRANVFVSPKNKHFSAIDGFPIDKRTQKPALLRCGKGFYRFYRNGKCGVIDEDLNVIIPCEEYDYVWSFDENDLFEVRLDKDKKHGMVNKQGEEIISAIYDDITLNDDLTYSAKHGNTVYRIDKNGKSR